MKKAGILILASLSWLIVLSQKNIDVLHYKYEILLSDQSDTIYGRAEIKVRYLQAASSVAFDITTLRKDGKGMIVAAVEGAGSTHFTNYADSISIALLTPAKVGDTATFIISYHGIPHDGMIISRNKFGDRTFFADNWPNRGHHWIPCVDNVADKASVEFIVTAPSHYQVIGNGVQIEETNLPDNKKLTHWKEDVPLPIKVIVIGAADFAVQYTGDVNCVPVTTWVYAKNRSSGFSDYAVAKDILGFFSSYIDPYPYKKLANVQSLTTFGGMENASAIFYFENSVDGKKDQETLFAHEIAHQWFGNMATEKSFAHLWLSEGFATYLTTIYMEKKYGTDTARAMRLEDRDQVIAFVKNNNHPVVDSVSPYMSLLNANSYQKGGWILHMLRRQLGDTIFHKSIQNYYELYAGKNADTRDLQRVFEKISGKNLSVFFQQWLYTPGIPTLDIKWKYDSKKHDLAITIQQTQAAPFVFPLDISVGTVGTKARATTLQVSQALQVFHLPLAKSPQAIELDPDVNLLFAGKIIHTP